jgi:hypothetical protein
MKKIIGIFAVTLLIATAVLPVLGAMNIEKTNESDYKIINKMVAPPDWAMGEFNGSYGTLKQPTIELGWANGYWSSHLIGYTRFERGRVEGYFGEWEDEEPTDLMEVEMLSFHSKSRDYMTSFLNGKISNLITNKVSFCFGIGRIGNFDGTINWKILQIPGDNLYITGNWSLFED